MSGLGLLGWVFPTPTRVTLLRRADPGSDGAPELPPVELPARIEWGARQIQTLDGRVVTAAARVTLPATPAIVPGHRLLIDGVERTVEVVTRIDWWDGTPMHHEVQIT